MHPLVSLADPELITQTVAAIFDLREGGNRLLLDKLIDSLRDKTALLVFDNCEHLLDACAGLINTLLAQCPGLKVLATSREPLAVPGEVQVSVAPLAVPPARVTVITAVPGSEGSAVIGSSGAAAGSAQPLGQMPRGCERSFRGRVLLGNKKTEICQYG